MRGEVALVIAKLGFDNRMIGVEIMSVAVMAMVLSIVITSVKLPKAIQDAIKRLPTIFDATVEAEAEAHA